MKKKQAEDAGFEHIERDLWPLAIPIEGLQLDPKQARNHDERSIAEIAASLEKGRQKKNIVVQRDGMIVKAGNGTLLAARKLGWTHLAAVVSDDPDTLIREYAIRDNRTAELSSWNPEVLALEIEELSIATSELGWNPLEFGELMAYVDLSAAARGGGAEPPKPPDDFPEVDEQIPTDYCCPKCGYRWSGKAGAA